MHRAKVWGKGAPAALFACALFLLVSVGPAAADHKPEGQHGGVGTTTAPVEAAEPGWIWVPTAGPDRLFQPVSAHGVSLWYLDTIAPGGMFALEPQKPGTGVCTLGSCVQTLDFDIVFYKKESGGFTSVVARYDTLGDEAGTVPTDASFALVFLKTPGMIPDVGQGHGFFYRQGDPGQNRLPTI